MLNIVIPMAGLGSRFVDAGYAQPKPLIPVFGRPMIELVVANLRPCRPHRFIFICRRIHIDTYPLESLLHNIAPGSINFVGEIVSVDIHSSPRRNVVS